VSGTWRAALAVAALAASGCGQYIVEGVVTDTAGEALPGVAVRVEETDAEALSNGVGRFRVRTSGNEATLIYAKTGYAGARQSVERTDGIVVNARAVALWKLPLRSGVYLLEGGIYREATRALPQRFLLREGGAVYGTRRAADAAVEELLPRLIFFQTPRYDAVLARLMPTEVAVLGEGGELPVWTVAGTIKPPLEALPGSENQLFTLRLDDALEPGVYAVHWGALEGRSGVDSQAYLFEVLEPPAPEEPEEGGETAEGETPEDAADGEDAGESESAPEPESAPEHEPEPETAEDETPSVELEELEPIEPSEPRG
jgi:hypothetical protein